MTLLDLLADWGPYAPTLIYVWFMAAYIVAGVRGHRYLTNRQRLIYFGSSLSFLSIPVFMYLWSPWRNLDQHLLWWAISSAVFIVWPLILNQGLISERKRWRAFGYAWTADVLLFRRPAEMPMPEEITDVERRSNRSMYWALLAVAAGLMVVGSLSASLGPCEWLDIASGRSGCWRTLSTGDRSISEIAFSPDGTIMVAADYTGPLRFYNAADGAVLRELPDQQANCGKSVSFSPDNKWVATISKDGVVLISDVQTGDLVHSLPAVTSTQGIKFSPDGKYLAVSLAQSSLQLWRTTDWTVHQVIAVPVYSINFSADGRWLAARTDDNRIGIWKMDDGTIYQTIHGPVYQMALSPDGRELATVSFDVPIKIWDVSTGKLSRTIAADTDGVFVYSPDGHYLLTDENYSRFLSYIQQINIWRAADGQRVATLPTDTFVSCAAFASKSNVFAYGTWKGLKIFRLRQY